MSYLPDWIAAIASAASAIGVVFAVRQLRHTRQIHQKQFLELQRAADENFASDPLHWACEVER
jgi:hypothetical protein